MAKMRRSGQSVWGVVGSQLLRTTLLIQWLPQQPTTPEEGSPRGPCSGQQDFRALSPGCSECLSILELGSGRGKIWALASAFHQSLGVSLLLILPSTGSGMGLVNLW